MYSFFYKKHTNKYVFECHELSIKIKPKVNCMSSGRLRGNFQKVKRESF
jgi:hypothetical protein